jgi:hypothetical protein
MFISATANVNSNLGFFGGSNLPRKLDGFWILQRRQNGRVCRGSEARSLKELKVFRNSILSIFLISQGEVAASQRGAVRRKAAGATEANQPGGFRREQQRHDCGSFPYFRAG